MKCAKCSRELVGNSTHLYCPDLNCEGYSHNPDWKTPPMKPKETKLNPPCLVGHLNHVWSQDIGDCYCIKCGILLDNCTPSSQPSPQSWHKAASEEIVEKITHDYEVGNSSRFCDDPPDWDSADVQTLVDLVQQILACHYEAENKELLQSVHDWRAYALHQEWCQACGNSDDCETGHNLKITAMKGTK